MSLVSKTSSIKYGESSIITVYDLSNVLVQPMDSVSNIEVTAGSVIITVIPQISTIYYISGYNAFQQQINLNETIYVNITIMYENHEISTDFNTIVELNVFGSSSYKWFPETYLNQTTGNSVLCTPSKNIRYSVMGTDPFNSVSRTYIDVKVNTNIIFTPSNNITIYDGNLLNLSGYYITQYNENPVRINIGNYKQYPDENIVLDSEQYLEQLNNSQNYTYQWLSNFYNGLPSNCCKYQYGEELVLHPYKTIEYTLTIINNSNREIISYDTVKINVVSKPSHIIDVDILPYSIYKLVINRNKTQLSKELLQNKQLSKKIIYFYYTILQTAYRMEWTNKNGIPFVVQWQTLYQITNKSNEMILSFEQQWKFFQYINNSRRSQKETSSNFAYLMNVINSIYLEHPQKVYLINM